MDYSVLYKTTSSKQGSDSHSLSFFSDGKIISEQTYYINVQQLSLHSLCLELLLLLLLLLLLVLRHLLADLLRGIEDAQRRFVAHEALLVLRVVLEHY